MKNNTPHALFSSIKDRQVQRTQEVIPVTESPPATIIGETLVVPFIKKVCNLAAWIFKPFHNINKRLPNLLPFLSVADAYPLISKTSETASMCMIPELSKLAKESIFVNEKLRSYFISDRLLSKNKEWDLLIFLHGLESQIDLSDVTLEGFKEISERASQLGCLSVFPLGIQGIFPDKETYLAWSPDKQGNNLLYLEELVKKIKSSVKIKKIFLGGFSNGAVFVSETLQKNEAKITFDGYWIQGGGYIREIAPRTYRNHVVIDISKDDKWHYDKLKALKDYLLKNGWDQNTNLAYREFSGPHCLMLEDLEKTITFLQNHGFLRIQPDNYEPFQM